jgi:hypothetical protein
VATSIHLDYEALSSMDVEQSEEKHIDPKSHKLGEADSHQKERDIEGIPSHEYVVLPP